MSLVIVGSLAFDTIETPKERKERIIVLPVILLIPKL